MKRRDYLALTGTLATAGFAGCTSNSGQNSTTGGDSTEPSQTTQQDDTGVLAAAVSDRPGDIGDFEHLIVTVNEIWVHPKGSGDEDTTDTNETTTNETAAQAPDPRNNPSNTTQNDTETETAATPDSDKETSTEDGSEDGGPIRISIDGGAKVDLVKLQGDAQSIIKQTELPTGTYSQIKLHVGDKVDAKLKTGKQADVMTPGNAPLKFNKEFEIKSETKTTFVADFTPVKRGPNGYVLQPVAKEVGVSYTPLESTPETTTGSETEQTRQPPTTISE